MEGKNLVAVLVTMMVMGNLLPQTEAQKIPFMQCYPACIVVCKSESTFPKFLKCPFTCIKTCLHPPSPPPSPSPSPSPSENTIDQTDH
ncbi:hypothetical protein ISN45_Aa01g004680 [Arabidopsis thaliana x Arabidopsis arenosa]|uniref:Plant thionin family protein n=1 Tax=Arabidopsis thaliana x Arabidopsis arenosa TaxID=1240361 RepID=A0A8T2BYX4_9BRAS|nr:hypothetical protein ISN45_Aa01g004680 [Arabidopsis thaliana x Arabidopsis arenosa]